MELRAVLVEWTSGAMHAHQQHMSKWRSALHTASLFSLAANVTLLSAAALNSAN